MRRALPLVMLAITTRAPLAFAQQPQPTEPALGGLSTRASVVARAVEDYRAGRYGEAADVLAAYVHRHPAEHRVWRLLGDCYLKLRRWEDAVRAFEQALQHIGSDPSTAAAESSLALAKARADNAREFRRQLETHGDLMSDRAPDSAEWHMSFGAALERRGDREAAVTVYRYFLYNFREAAPVHLRLARLFRGLGRKGDAMREFSALVSAGGDDPAGWTEYIAMLVEEGKHDNALRVSHEAVARFGNAEKFRETLAILYHRNNQLPLAARQYAILRSCRSADGVGAELSKIPIAVERRLPVLAAQIERNPNDFEAAEELRRLYLALDRPDGAVKVYRRLTRLHPGHVGLMKRLAELYHRAGMNDEARGVYTALVNLTQGDLSVRLAYARLLGWIERYDESLAELRALSEIAPRDPRVPVYTAFTLLWMGSTHDALARFEEALARNPEDEGLIEQIQLLRGQYDELLPRRLRRYRLDPIDGNATLGLADLLQRMGDRDAAGRLYQEYMALAPDDNRARRSFARVLAENGEYVTAVQHYLHLLDRTKEKKDRILRELADIYLWGGFFLRARDTYRDLLSRNPADTYLLIGMGRACLWDGALHDAIYYFGLALASDPDNADARKEYDRARAAADIYWEEQTLDQCLDKKQSATDAVVRATHAAPDVIQVTGLGNLESLLGRAEKLYRAGKFDEVMLLYRAYVSRLPAEHPDLLRLGTVGRYLDRLRKSALKSVFDQTALCRVTDPVQLAPLTLRHEASYTDLIAGNERRLAGDPRDTDALLALAQLHYVLGKYSKSASYYARYVALDNSNPRIRLRLAMLYYESGRYVEAANMFEALSDHYTGRVCVDLYLANALFRSRKARGGAPDEVIRLYQKFLDSNPKAVWPLHAIGTMHAEEGDTENALDAFRRAMNRDPSNRQVIRAYITTLVDAGRMPQALDLLNRRFGGCKDQGLLMLLAQNIERLDQSKRDERGALPLVEECLRQQPELHKVRLALARSLAQAGRLDDAYRHFQAYLNYEPNNMGVILELVGLLNSARAYDRSLEVLDGALSRIPDEPYLMKLRADVIRWRGIDVDKHRDFIIRAYEQYYVTNRDRDDSVLLPLAAEYGARGDTEMMELFIARYRQNHPFDDEARFVHAMAYMRLERPKDAIPLLRAYLRASPDNVDAVAMLISALVKTGDARGVEIRKLLNHLRQMRTQGKMTSAQLLTFARLLRELGHIDESIGVFRQYAQSAPPDDPARFELAGTLVDRGDNDGALKALRELVSASPERLDYLLMLARAESASSNPDDRKEAVRHFERYLQFKPDDARARLDYARLLEKESDWPEADEQFRIILSSNPVDPEWKSAEIGLVRSLQAREDHQAAVKVAEDLVYRLPHDTDARLAYASALEASGRGDEAEAQYRVLKKTTTATAAESRAIAEASQRRVDRNYGPRLDVMLQLFGDTDHLIEWSGFVGAGYRFKNLRTYLGGKYKWAFVSQTEALFAVPVGGAPLVEVAREDSDAVHSLLVELNHKFSNAVQLGGHAGVDIRQEGPRLSPDLRLQLDWQLNETLDLSYALWYRMLYLDVRSKAVLEQPLDGFWHRPRLGFNAIPDRLRFEVAYQGGFLGDQNEFHGLYLSGIFSFQDPEGLKFGLLFDYLEYEDGSILYWDPHNGLHPRLLVGYKVHPTVTTTFNAEGTLGFFHEDARDPFVVNTTFGPQTFSAEAADVLTYTLLLEFIYQPHEALLLGVLYQYGRAGPGLASAFYQSHTIRGYLTILW